MTEKGIDTYKKAAVEFLQMVVAGQIDEAYEKHVEMRGKHHNPFFPAGFTELKKGMKDNQVQVPNKKLTVKHVVGDGDLVAVHSHLVMKPKEMEMTVLHMFRFENGKVAEMWDIGQHIPPNSPNKDGAF